MPSPALTPGLDRLHAGGSPTRVYLGYGFIPHDPGVEMCVAIVRFGACLCPGGAAAAPAPLFAASDALGLTEW